MIRVKETVMDTVGSYSDADIHEHGKLYNVIMYNVYGCLVCMSCKITCC